MRKLIAIFMCLAMCLSFIGCNNIEKQNDEAKVSLNRVLNREQSFTVKSLVFDKVTEENLEKFSFPTESNAINAFIPQGYAYVDFDADGIEELLIVDATLTFFLVLRYDGGEVYGYVLRNISLQDIKTDGSFQTVIYRGYTAVSRVSFDGVDCEVSHLAYKDDSTKTYRLNEETTTKEAVEKYFDEWNENTTKISWVTMGT